MRSTRNSGLGLVEVMVALGIMSIMSMGFSTMLQMQNRELRYTSEKMTTQSFELSLKNHLAKNDFCGCLFRGQTINTNAPGGVGAWSTTAALPSHYTNMPQYPTPCTAAAETLVPPSGQPIGDSHVEVSTVSLNIQQVSGGIYSGEFVVQFSGNNLVRPLTAAKVPITITVDLTSGNPVSRPVMGCGASTGQNGKFEIMGQNVCPGGFETIQSGVLFGSSLLNNGSGASDSICLSGGFTRPVYVVNPGPVFGGYHWEAPPDCATCVTPGASLCFTNYGSNACPPGFAAAYTGFTFQKAYAGDGSAGKISCRAGASVGGLYVVNPTHTSYGWVANQPCSECCR